MFQKSATSGLLSINTFIGDAWRTAPLNRLFLMLSPSLMDVLSHLRKICNLSQITGDLLGSSSAYPDLSLSSYPLKAASDAFRLDVPTAGSEFERLGGNYKE